MDKKNPILSVFDEKGNRIPVPAITGLSAYQIDVKQGNFIGTEAEWLEWITPKIGANGNWWIKGEDTGVISRANVDDTLSLEGYSAEAFVTGNRIRAIESVIDACVVEENASGDRLVLNDSSSSKLMGLRVFGKTTQYKSTGAQLAQFTDKAAVTENGITWMCKDGVIVAQGKMTGTAQSNSTDAGIWADIPREAGTYYISGSTDAVSVLVEVSHGHESSVFKEEQIFILDGNETSVAVYCEVRTTGEVYDVVRPMLNRGSKPLDWEPYTGGVASPTPDLPAELVTVGSDGIIAVSLDDQRLEVSTPNGLPGIPLTLASSVGNYTDSDGQRWVCDEIDFERGVYIQRIGRKVFDGSENILQNGEVPFNYVISLESMGLKRAKPNVECFCSCFLGTKDDAVAPRNNNVISVTGKNLYFYTKSFSSAGGLTDYFRDAETPIEFLYQLAEPIETPLSEEQLAAYRELHTNKPTTVVSTDEGAWLSVKYTADTKGYIDNKFNELAAALISNT